MLRILMALALTFGLVTMVSVSGCKKSPEKVGGPGAGPKDSKDSKDSAGNKDAGKAGDTDSATTFSMDDPSSVSLHQGEKENVTLSINRGSEFKQKVTLSFKAPAGLKVDPAGPSIAADNNDAQISVEAMKDAKLGKHIIDVTATPETGQKAMTKIEVTVEEKK